MGETGFGKLRNVLILQKGELSLYLRKITRRMLFPVAENSVYNLGETKRVTIKEIAETVQKLANKNVEIRYIKVRLSTAIRLKESWAGNLRLILRKE